MAKMFWEMFDSLDQEERKKYLKFVWGRAKIPSDTSILEEKHEIVLLSSTKKVDSLPVAHTCYFTIDIPKYTDLATMTTRIKTAIEFCGEIDLDAGYGEEEEEEEDYDSEDQEEY